jgi:hypothetical protein
VGKAGAMKLIPIFYTILQCFTLFGCQYVTKHESKDAAPDSRIEVLKAKYEQIYAEVESGDLESDTGWPSNSDCDGLLWSSLACRVGMPVRIELAEYSPGELHRRPYKSCFSNELGDQGSKSTISRDMLTGYMSCLWERKDLAAFQRLADYGEKNDWIMGSPASLISRVLLTGNGIGILGRAIYVLSGGSDDRYYRRTGYLYPVVSEDYERHIQTQSILLQDQIDDGYNLRINGEMLDRLIENASAEPEDRLFAAALGRFTGDQSKTIELLLSEVQVCPSYARGEKPEVYCKLIWLQAAQIILGE